MCNPNSQLDAFMVLVMDPCLDLLLSPEVPDGCLACGTLTLRLAGPSSALRTFKPNSRLHFVSAASNVAGLQQQADSEWSALRVCTTYAWLLCACQPVECKL